MPPSTPRASESAPTFWLSGKRHAEQDHFFRRTLEAQQWKEGDECHWQAAWVTGMPLKRAFQHTSPTCKMNHIPGNAALTVKSRLHESLSGLRERMRHAFGDDHETVARLDFFPRAYEMPHDYPALIEDASANPHKHWILKPTNASKGQGVRVLKDPTTAPLTPNWLVQEYVANPHTIRGHKYVLRLYMLIASIDPLRVYLYDQGFAKLASEPWDPDDIDNPFSQLTNPDINALNIGAEIPVEFIDLERYREWLRDQGNDDDVLFHQLRDLATLTALSAADTMRLRTQEDGADPMGCYELIGLDCLVDDQLKPWILECNLSPSLGICAKPEHGGTVEEAVKGALVSDMLSLVGLYPRVTTPYIDAEALAAERKRSGGFVPLYPAATLEATLGYLPFIGLPSLADYQLASPELQQAIAFRAYGVSELIEGDQLALYHHPSGLYYQLNDSAALMWLMASEGESIEQMIAHLTAASGGQIAKEQLMSDLWATLTPWYQHGLLTLHTATSDEPKVYSERTASTAWQTTFYFAGRQWLLTAPSGAIAEHLASALSPLAKGMHDAALPAEPLHLLESANGYCLTNHSRVISARLKRPDILDAITRYCMKTASRAGELTLDIALLGNTQQQFACVLPAQISPGVLDTLAQVATQHGLSVTRGARLSPQSPTRLVPLNLPLSDHDWTPLPHQPLETPLVVIVLSADADTLSEPLSSLSLLGALLPTAYETEHHLSAESLQALQTLCQRSEQVSLSLASQGHDLDAWLSRHVLQPTSHAAV